MVQIPLLSGIYADTAPDLRTSFPVNLVPVPKASGVSQGYLRPGDGIVHFGTGPGVDRGGMEWNGVLYRAMGEYLCTVSDTGAVSIVGTIADDGNPARFDYSFDRLAIASGGNLYYYTTSLIQVTDPDLGTVVDMTWIDGYFMTTDGEYLIVTDLNNPLSINPLKYGSSEADPDPVVALLKIRNEAYAINRHTIEVFDNIGGQLFPFQRVEGAQIQKGAIGTNACRVYLESIAFLGSGENEAPSVYMGSNGAVSKIATYEIDLILAQYTEQELSRVLVETRNEGSSFLLYIHLHDRTLVYDAGASQEVEQRVWFVLTTATEGFEQYRARNFVWAYNRWICGDPQDNSLGYITRDVSSHWGAGVRWEFGTLIVYNESRAAIFHELELVSLTGSYALPASPSSILLEDGDFLLLEDEGTFLLETSTIGTNPVLWSQYSVDGVTWSSQRAISAGTQGQRSKRLCWFQQGYMQDRRIQRFGGQSDAHIAFVRLEARLEPLNA